MQAVAPLYQSAAVASAPAGRIRIPFVGDDPAQLLLVASEAAARIVTKLSVQNGSPAAAFLNASLHDREAC